MEKDQMKSILAGMGIASLVACMAAVPINAQGASGWGGESSAGGTSPHQEAGKSGCGGKSGVVDAEKDKDVKDKEATQKAKNKKPAEKPAEKPAQEPGSSGWGGATGAGGAK